MDFIYEGTEKGLVQFEFGSFSGGSTIYNLPLELDPNSRIS